MEFEDLDEEALEQLAARVAKILEPGDVIVLAGEVGSGKTTFVRAAARALGVAERVTSPTYQIARDYEGYAGGRKILVNHLDLYRIEGLESRDVLELDDYLDPRAVTFVEWAEPALEILERPSIVEISHHSPATRTIRLSGPASERLARC